MFWGGRAVLISSHHSQPSLAQHSPGIPLTGATAANELQALLTCVFWSLNYSSSNVCTQFITSPAQAPVGTYLGEISSKLDDYSSRRANTTHNNCRLQILLISMMYWSREPKREWERYSKDCLDGIFLSWLQIHLYCSCFGNLALERSHSCHEPSPLLSSYHTHRGLFTSLLLMIKTLRIRSETPREQEEDKERI